MNTRTHYMLALGLLLLAVLPFGCGGDDDKDGGGGSTLKGEYELYAGFMNEEDLPDSPTQTMVFVADVERLNSADPSAMTAVVTVDGTPIPLLTGSSTPESAIFQSDAIEYEAGATYAVSISIGEETATSTIVSPTDETTVHITAPADGAEFTPNQPLPMAWSYDDEPPAKVVIWATGSSDDEDEDLYEVSYSGNFTTATIPNAETNTWGSFDDIYLAVGAGVTQIWSGAMAADVSYSYVMLSMDTVTIHPAGGATTWTVTVTPTNASIATGGTTTITVEIEDDEGGHPPVGTVVNLSVAPSGAASIAPATVQTDNAGTATATLTAGSTPGTVTVTAVAPSLDNASDNATVTITGGGGEVGEYFINGGFVTAAENPMFIAVVHRLNAEDTSAMDAVVTVNGTEIPLFELASVDSLASFMSTTITYAASTNYQIVVSLGGKTATSSFTSPSYMCTIELTSPAPQSAFTPGVDLEAAWTLTGSNPTMIRIFAGCDGADEGDPGYTVEELAGTARSYSIDTSEWTGCEAASVVVSVDEFHTFTGDLAAENSISYINLTTDVSAVVPGGGSGDEYTVTVTTGRAILEPDGADTTMVRARVENGLGQPCPDGQTVTFSIVSGLGTLSDETALTAGGWATTILTAGAEEGTVTIQAEAYEDSDQTTVLVTESVPQEYVMLVTFPDLGTPILAPGGTTTLHVILQTLSLDPCPNGIEITLHAEVAGEPTDYLTFGDMTLTTVDGEAETTVTVGATVPALTAIAVHAETEAVEYSGGIGVLVIMP
jgi:hypothetical protein